MTYTIKLYVDPLTNTTVLEDNTDYGPLGLLSASFKIYNSADVCVEEQVDYDPSAPFVFDKVVDGLYRIEYTAETTILGVVAETHYGFVDNETLALLNDRLMKWADPDVVCCKEFPVGLKVLFEAIQLAVECEQYDRCELILYRVKQQLANTCKGC